MLMSELISLTSIQNSLNLPEASCRVSARCSQTSYLRREFPDENIPVWIPASAGMTVLGSQAAFADNIALNLLRFFMPTQAWAWHRLSLGKFKAEFVIFIGRQVFSLAAQSESIFGLLVQKILSAEKVFGKVAGKFIGQTAVL